MSSNGYSNRIFAEVDYLGTHLNFRGGETSGKSGKNVAGLEKVSDIISFYILHIGAGEF